MIVKSKARIWLMLVIMMSMLLVGCGPKDSNSNETNSDSIINREINNETHSEETVMTNEKEVVGTETPPILSENEISTEINIKEEETITEEATTTEEPTTVEITTEAPTTEEPTTEESTTQETKAIMDNYVLNTHTMKVHYPTCNSVPKIKPENRDDVVANFQDLLNQGYSSCGNCHAH